MIRQARAEQQAPAEPNKTKEVLTDAAIIALDTMKNWRACGGNSAYSRAGGFKPLCFATDVTPAMIAAYRATRAIPSLR